jgi:hypothetical protein
MKNISKKSKKEIKLPLIFELLKWKIIDLYRLIKYGRKIHLYGIRAFVGLYGGGKTMGMTYYLHDIRQNYGDKVLIATNYYYKGQDFAITKWEDLLPEYDKPVIFAYDELQNEFNSREYKGFPVQLMTLLTQNRKGKGKQIIYTCQDYETVDKNFRRLTKDVGVCRTLFGRLTNIKFFNREEYEMLISNPDINKRMKVHRKFTMRFVQTDTLRDSYDSFQMLDSAKSKQYVEQLNKVVDIRA